MELSGASSTPVDVWDKLSTVLVTISNLTIELVFVVVNALTVDYLLGAVHTVWWDIELPLTMNSS